MRERSARASSTRSRRAGVTCAGLIAVAIVAGCTGGGAPDVVVSDPALGATDSAVAAMYLDFTNRGSGDDAVVSATCPCADKVTLHITDNSNGRSMMVDSDVLELPAGEDVRMGPAGSHVMLEQLNVPLEVGDSVEVTLEFDRSASQTIEVPVVALDSLVERVAR